MKSEYRNSIRSKKMIRDALITLLEKSSLSEITITDIVNTAGINRGTFYNHYSNPIEVLEEIKNELFDKLTESIRINIEKGDLDSFLDMMMEYFRKNEDLYRKILKGIPQSIISDLKISFLNQIKYLKGSISETRLYFIVDGLAGVYIDYLQDRIKISLDDLNRDIKKIIKELLPIWWH